MKTTPTAVTDAAGQPIARSKALLFGNNCSWVCAKAECGALLAGRTGDSEILVSCPDCGTRYEILRGENKNGDLHQGPATGVRLLQR